MVLPPGTTSDEQVMRQQRELDVVAWLDQQGIPVVPPSARVPRAPVTSPSSNEPTGNGANLGLWRNEYLRRRFEQSATEPGERTVTAEDWRRSAETFADLADPDVMARAWR